MLKRGRNRGFYAICCPMEAFRIFSNPGKYGAFVGVGERVALRRDAVALAAQFAFEHRHDVAGLFLVACCVFIAPRILARENLSSNLFLLCLPLRNGIDQRCVIGGGFLHFYGMVVDTFLYPDRLHDLRTRHFAFKRLDEPSHGTRKCYRSSCRGHLVTRQGGSSWRTGLYRPSKPIRFL